MIPLFLKIGTHYAQAVEEYFKAGELDINALKNINGTITPVEIKNVEELRRSIDNKEKLYYWDTSSTAPKPELKDLGADKFRKTIFPRDWTVEDIARAGAELFRNPIQVNRIDPRTGEINPDLFETVVTIKGQTIKIEGFISNDQIWSWYPVY